jgi:hypothetical protein
MTIGSDVGNPTTEMTQEGCEITPECDYWGDGSGDPNPEASGYWLGSTVTPAACFSPSGAGITDRDYDGMHDYCEERLAGTFAPQLVFSLYESWGGREEYWAAKYFPSHGNEVRIAYLLSYYLDPGVTDPTFLQSLGCPGVWYLGKLGTFQGLLPDWEIPLPGLTVPVRDENFCEGHVGDSEFLTVDIQYQASTQHWVLKRVFFSAHFLTNNDRSTLVDYYGIEYPDKYRGYPQVWVAQGKHANYATRDACTAGGILADHCQSNGFSTATRVRYSPWYNIGSTWRNLVNRAYSPGSCVASQSPYRGGVECFWRSDHDFYGWDEFRPAGQGASPYVGPLVARFECHSYTDDGSGRLTCSDWGVSRGP